MELLFVLGLIGAEIVTVISDEPAPTNSSNALQAALPVPLWVIVLVCGLIGFVILVASVALIVCLIQRSKQKKQEQRDKGSIWINEDMAKDWTLSRNNKVFPMVSSPESTAETEMSHPYLTYKNSYTYHGSVQPFSSFRTWPDCYYISKSGLWPLLTRVQTLWSVDNTSILCPCLPLFLFECQLRNIHGCSKPEDLNETSPGPWCDITNDGLHTL